MKMCRKHMYGFLAAVILVSGLAVFGFKGSEMNTAVIKPATKVMLPSTACPDNTQIAYQSTGVVANSDDSTPLYSTLPDFLQSVQNEMNANSNKIKCNYRIHMFPTSAGYENHYNYTCTPAATVYLTTGQSGSFDCVKGNTGMTIMGNSSSPVAARFSVDNMVVHVTGTRYYIEKY